MVQPLQESFISMRTRRGLTLGSIADVVASSEDGILTDLPGMRPHQRGQVVTGMAIITHLTRRYSGKRSVSAQDVISVFEGLPPLPLYPVDGEPGFMQMAFKKGAVPKEASWQELDPLFFGIGHVGKASYEESPDHESILFSLMATGDRRYVKGNPNGPRWGMLTVLPSVDGSIGSEIRVLADAYDAALGAGRTGGHPWKKARKPSDHMPFLLPPDRVLTHSDMAWPPLDSFRPVRAARGNGPARALIVTSDPRCTKALTNSGVADPHVALSKKGYMRAYGRPMDHRHVHAALFGTLSAPKATKKKPAKPKVEIERAAIMDGSLLSADAAYVRVCGTGTDNGKTLGFREQTHRLPVARVVSSFDDDGADTVGLASQYALSLAATMMGTVGFSAGHVDPSLEDVARREFEDLTSRRVIEWTLGAVDPDAFEASKPELNRILRDAALEAYDTACEEARSTGAEWLAMLRRRVLLERKCRFTVPVPAEETKSKGEHEHMTMTSAADRYVGRVLRIAVAVGANDTETAKSIRSSLNGPPSMAHWKVLADVGATDAEAISSGEALRTVVNAVAVMPHGRTAHLGRELTALHITDDRIERLLEDTGASLCQGVMDVAYSARSKGLRSFDWRHLGALCLAEAAGDVEAVTELRTKIGLAYCRGQLRRNRA